MNEQVFGLPLWLRITHFANFTWLTFERVQYLHKV